MGTAFVVVAIIIVSVILIAMIIYGGGVQSLPAIPPLTSSEGRTTTSLSGSTSTTFHSTTTTLPPGVLGWLEQRTHQLVNVERMKAGLNNLTWNEEVAEVARAHSTDMAQNDFFSHTGSGESNMSSRLHASDVYYWNSSGENLLVQSLVKYYIMNRRGEVMSTTFKDLEGFAQDAVDGWMASPGHRENILTPGFDEAGMGVIDNGNYSFYFTQNFITRINCGFKDGPCCETVGYLPWCYIPYECVADVCRE